MSGLAYDKVKETEEKSRILTAYLLSMVKTNQAYALCAAYLNSLSPEDYKNPIGIIKAMGKYGEGEALYGFYEDGKAENKAKQEAERTDRFEKGGIDENGNTKRAGLDDLLGGERED